MLSAMPTSSLFSLPSNPNLLPPEFIYPCLDCCHMHPILSYFYPPCYSNNCYNLVFVYIWLALVAMFADCSCYLHYFVLLLLLAFCA